MSWNPRFMYAVIDWNYSRSGKRTTRVEIRNKITGQFLTGINHLKSSRDAWAFAMKFTGNIVDLRYR